MQTQIRPITPNNNIGIPFQILAGSCKAASHLLIFLRLTDISHAAVIDHYDYKIIIIKKKKEKTHTLCHSGRQAIKPLCNGPEPVETGRRLWPCLLEPLKVIAS